MGKQLVIRSKNGKAEIEAKGYKGQSCVEPVEMIAKIFGEVIATHLKPTYYMDEENDKEICFEPHCG